jgi:prophage regulatory protein
VTTSNSIIPDVGQRVLSLAEVCIKCGLSKSTLYAAIKAGTFPKPLKLTERRSAWLLSEIDAWIEAKRIERDAVASKGLRS